MWRRLTFLGMNDGESKGRVFLFLANRRQHVNAFVSELNAGLFNLPGFSANFDNVTASNRDLRQSWPHKIEQ